MDACNIDKDKGKDENKAKELSEKNLSLNKYKNEKNLMMFPFCSTSKSKRINPIYFASEDKEVWLEVTANNTYGMAKVWDFDIIRFVLSKINAIFSETNHYPPKVSFTAYECLKALNKSPRSGNNVKWLKEALDRLASTTYKGNIFRKDNKKVTGFTLLRYEYDEPNGVIEKIIITLDERLTDSIKNSENLLDIDYRLLREKSGIKKRLLELVAARMDGLESWEVSLEYLQSLCAHDGKISRFKFELSSYQNMPWHVSYEKRNTNVFVIFDIKNSDTRVSNYKDLL